MARLEQPRKHFEDGRGAVSLGSERLCGAELFASLRLKHEGDDLPYCVSLKYELLGLPL